MVDLKNSSKIPTCPRCGLPLWRKRPAPIWRCLKCRRDWFPDDLNLEKKSAEDSKSEGGGSQDLEKPNFCPSCGSSWGKNWKNKCKNCGHEFED